MRDPLATITAARTPQTQPLPGRAQVRNAAGGYVFAKDQWTQLEDFLILGVTGGTYYVSADELARPNVDVLYTLIADDGPRVVALIREVATAQPARAPKPRPYLFALAVAAAKGDPSTVQAVKAAFPAVVRTTDHLAMFYGYWKNQVGKLPAHGTMPRPVIGRAIRSTLASFFTADDLHVVAFRALKARQRKTSTGEPMELRDIIRVAHPVSPTAGHRALIGWLAGKVSNDEAREVLPDLDDFVAAQAVRGPDEAIRVISDRRVPWEFLPSHVLNDAAVWAELAGTVGLTALIRNLARMTRLGTLAPFAETNERVVSRLTDGEAIIRARIHPMDLYLALKVYASGVSQSGSGKHAQTWHPVPAIVDALELAYDLSFGAVEPSGRRLLVAVDSSASMSKWSRVTSGGSALGTAYEVANTMAVMLARIEGASVHVIEADTSVHASKVTPHTTLRELVRWRSSGRGTDMSLPFSWALDRRLDVAGFVILTDGETWAGKWHAAQAFDAYRRSVNPAARVVVVAMTATGQLIADPSDDGVLGVAGLDGALPKLITGFIRS
jgi:60 kDa SS-A/Ro ribonucleoprotein